MIKLIPDSGFQLKHKKPHIWHLASGIWHLVFGICLFAGIWHLASGICLFAEPKKEISREANIVEERIKTSVNKVLAILKDKNLDRETKKIEVRKIVDPLFDIPLMAKLVIGPKHWSKFSDSQRKEFTELFVRALQDSYFEKVDLLTDEYVEFEKPIAVGNKFQMLTYIVAKDKRYAMLFKLYQKKSSESTNWMVYDVEIEGISFVRSYSSQYNQFLQKNSPKDLLARLREKTLDVPEELKAKKKKEQPVKD